MKIVSLRIIGDEESHDREYDRRQLDERGMVGQAKFMRITPTLSTSLLAKKNINRKMSPVHVEKFVRLIRSGLWCSAASFIHISKEGILLNGQHRLTAIVETGITVYSWVLSGLSDEVFYFLDQHSMARMMQHMLPDTVESRAQMQAIANAIYDIRHNKWVVVANDALDIFYEFEQDIQWAWETFKDKVAIKKKRLGHPFSLGVVACFAYAHHVSRLSRKVERFADDLMGRKGGYIANLLESACENTTLGGSKGRHIISKKTFSAIQAYCEDKRPSNLRLSSDGIDWAREMAEDPTIFEEKKLRRKSKNAIQSNPGRNGGRAARGASETNATLL